MDTATKIFRVDTKVDCLQLNEVLFCIAVLLLLHALSPHHFAGKLHGNLCISDILLPIRISVCSGTGGCRKSGKFHLAIYSAACIMYEYCRMS